MEYRLSEMQKKTVEHGRGPALVLAGPGSGKTTVIAARVIRLERNLCGPDEIMTLSFGRSAAEEMRKRYDLYRNTGDEGALFCTVHSICLKILREKYRNITVIDETRRAEIVKRIFADVNGDTETDIKQLVTAISRQRNLSGSGRTVPPQIFRFREICSEYEKFKKQNNMADYDDMIFTARDILKENPEIREKYAKKFVQCDEAQDLSTLQFEIISMLCREGNIFAVADDDQSIYGFRGAEPACILNFEKYYPECTVYRLEENYRSTKKIVEFAGKIATKNSERCEKNIFTCNENGTGTEIRKFGDGVAQAYYILDRIQSLLRKKGKTENLTMGVLYRNNISALIIMLLLTVNNIGFTVLGSGFDTENYPEVKHFTDRLRMEEEKRIILPSAASVLKKAEKEGLITEALEECEKTGRQKRTAYEIFEFLSVLCEYAESYGEVINLMRRMGEMAKEKQKITLSTVHSAKGLEFDEVIVMDMVNGEFPGTGALSGKLLEEERRLYYVAVTRAKKRLTVTYPCKRAGMTEIKSILLEK